LANLAETLWQHRDDGKATAIRLITIGHTAFPARATRGATSKLYVLLALPLSPSALA